MTWRNTTGEHLGWTWKSSVDVTWRLFPPSFTSTSYHHLPLSFSIVTWEHPVPFSSTQVTCTLWLLQTLCPSAIYLLVTMWFVYILPKNTFSPASYKITSPNTLTATLKFQCNIQQEFLCPFTLLTVVQPFFTSHLQSHQSTFELDQLPKGKRTWKWEEYLTWASQRHSASAFLWDGGGNGKGESKKIRGLR